MHLSALSLQRRQRLFNALALCAVEGGDGSDAEAPSIVANLLCFIGDQLLLPENDSLSFESQKFVGVRPSVCLCYSYCFFSQAYPFFFKYTLDLLSVYQRP